MAQQPQMPGGLMWHAGDLWPFYNLVCDPSSVFPNGFLLAYPHAQPYVQQAMPYMLPPYANMNLPPGALYAPTSGGGTSQGGFATPPNPMIGIRAPTDVGDPDAFLATASDADVVDKRATLAGMLQYELAAREAALRCHLSFRKEECDARVGSLQRECQAEMGTVEEQIKSLKLRLAMLEEYKRDAVADAEMLFEEVADRLERERDAAARAHEALAATCLMSGERARAEVASIMRTLRSTALQDAARSLSGAKDHAPPSPAAVAPEQHDSRRCAPPLSVGPEITAYEADAARDTAERARRAYEDARKSAPGMAQGERAVLQWLAGGPRPHTRDAVQWLRGNAALASGLAQHMTQLAAEACEESDFFERLALVARKRPRSALDRAADSADATHAQQQQQGHEQAASVEGNSNFCGASEPVTVASAMWESDGGGNERRAAECGARLASSRKALLQAARGPADGDVEESLCDAQRKRRRTGLRRQVNNK